MRVAISVDHNIPPAGRLQWRAGVRRAECATRAIQVMWGQAGADRIGVHVCGVRESLRREEAQSVYEAALCATGIDLTEVTEILILHYHGLLGDHGNTRGFVASMTPDGAIDLDLAQTGRRRCPQTEHVVEAIKTQVASAMSALLEPPR
jgi:hypothetical protein